jgi:hypothetical protein
VSMEQHLNRIIEQRLNRIIEEFTPSEDEPTLTMFGLISRYNALYDNVELIGGQWVLENTNIRLLE